MGTASYPVFTFEKVGQFPGSVRFREICVDAALAALNAAPACECRGDFILCDEAAHFREFGHLGGVFFALQAELSQGIVDLIQLVIVEAQESTILFPRSPERGKLAPEFIQKVGVHEAVRQPFGFVRKTAAANRGKDREIPFVSGFVAQIAGKIP